MKAQSFTDFVLLTCYCLKNGFIYRLPFILPCLILVESPPFSWFYYVKLKFLCEGILHAELKQAWSWFELKHFSPSIIDEKMPNVVSPILLPAVLFSSQEFKLNSLPCPVKIVHATCIVYNLYNTVHRVFSPGGFLNLEFAQSQLKIYTQSN